MYRVDARLRKLREIRQTRSCSRVHHCVVLKIYIYDSPMDVARVQQQIIININNNNGINRCTICASQNSKLL